MACVYRHAFVYMIVCVSEFKAIFDMILIRCLFVKSEVILPT